MSIILKDRPCIIHSDIIWTLKFVKKLYIKNNDIDISQLHLNYLSNYLGSDNLIFPSFNYDFPKTKEFDIRNTPSDVGHLSNYILNSKDYTRTQTPVFSFLTKIKELIQKKIDYPFLKDSVFDYLYQNDGLIIFYGTNISHCTYLHYVESQIDMPIYRYDKTFKGFIINETKIENVKVTFHVRPLNLDLKYNFEKLYSDIFKKNVIINFDKGFYGIKASDLSNIWGEELSRNPFAYLSEASGVKIKNKYNELGRRFIISDFE